MAQEIIGKDINGQTDFSLPFPTLGAISSLAATTEQTYVCPPGYNRVFFSYSAGSNVIVTKGNITVGLPTASFALSLSEVNPAVRQLSGKGGETLRFISDTASWVQLRFDQGGQ